MLLHAGLGGMLQGSGEDVLHLVLECLAAVIRVDDEGAQAWEAHITPCVLQLWVQHAADPLLAMEAGGVIQALAAGPAFPNLLVSRPTLQAPALLADRHCSTHTRTPSCCRPAVGHIVGHIVRNIAGHKDVRRHSAIGHWAWFRHRLVSC